MISLNNSRVIWQKDINSTRATVFIGIRGSNVVLGEPKSDFTIIQPLAKFDPNAGASVPFYSNVWGLDAARGKFYTLHKGTLWTVDATTFQVTLLRNALSDTACGGPWVLSNSLHAQSQSQSSLLPGSVAFLSNSPVSDWTFTFGNQLFGQLPGSSAAVVLTSSDVIEGTSSTGLLNCAAATKDTFLSRGNSLEGFFVSVLSLPEAKVVYSHKLGSLFDSSHVDYRQSVAWVRSRKAIALLQASTGLGRAAVELSVESSNMTVLFSVPAATEGFVLDKNEEVWFSWSSNLSATSFFTTVFVAYLYPAGKRLEWSLELPQVWDNGLLTIATDAKSNRFWILTCSPFCSFSSKNMTLVQYSFTENSVAVVSNTLLGVLDPVYFDFDASSSQIIIITRSPGAIFRVDVKTMALVSHSPLPFLSCGSCMFVTPG